MFQSLFCSVSRIIQCFVMLRVHRLSCWFHLVDRSERPDGVFVPQERPLDRGEVRVTEVEGGFAPWVVCGDGFQGGVPPEGVTGDGGKWKIR